MTNIVKRLGIKLTILTFFSTIVFSSLVIMTVPASACGCGMVVVGNPGSNVGWSYSNDFTEQSYINLENKTEKLIISLDIQQRSNDAVLIIPIPTKPEAVKADVLAETPLFQGYNVTNKAKDELPKIRDGVLATQIYPAIPKVISSLLAQPAPQVPNYTGSAISSGAIGAAVAPPTNTDITVYQHLEKDGLVTEVLTAANSTALYNYLTQKGLNVTKDSIPIVKDYISNNFSFVVSWINPNTSYSSAKGLQINFPSSNIYYPLKPGSAYSGPGLEKSIYVVGYVSPNLYGNIKSSTTVDYFYSDQPTQFPGFYTSAKNYGFTRLLINSDPKNLTQDLYMSKRAPLKILNAQAMNIYTFVYAIILLMIAALAAVYFAVRMLSFIETKRPQQDNAPLQPGQQIPTVINPQAVVSPIQGALLQPQAITQPTMSKKLPTLKTILKLWIASWFTIIGTVVASVLFLPKGKRLKFMLVYSITFTVLVWLFWYLCSMWYGS